jgi:endo-1,4-beta-D-glucanase Y
MRSVLREFFSVSVVGLLLACGSNDPGPGPGSGGSTTSGRGGSGGTSTSGSGGTAQTGGVPNPQGGVATGGSAVAGSIATGGVSGGSGGATSGGVSAGGGSAAGSGGRGGSNAAGSGAASGSGGTATGGAGGGVSTGGVAGGGGGATGGAATGGAAGGGTRGPCQPPLSYRNLFSELLSKSDADVDAKLAAGYAQLFHGGADKSVYYESGSDEAYILDANNNDVRSEGISYGMMISVQLDKKEEFNRLWKFAKQHMAMSGGNAGLFNWKTSSAGQVTGNGSAPDGEEYFATALMFASKRWGDGSGIFAYSTEAKTVLDALANKGLFNKSNSLVLFLQNSAYTDPSYMLPAFYEGWACFDTKNQAFWKGAVTAARAFLQKTTNATTGLAPYLANFDGTPNSGGSTFQSDPWRVVGNIMMDHHFFDADPWQTTFAQKYAAFFKTAMAMRPVPDEFNINGTPTHTNAEPSKGLVAQNAMVGFGVPAADGTAPVQALWDMTPPEGQYRYYDGMLYMLASLHVSGRFHLYY